MTKLIFTLLFFFVGYNTFSQFYIKGRVIDVVTQQPLRQASVYINNTTAGTTTNENGEFELGPFQPGRYEVIVSYVGYDPLRYSAEITSSGIRIAFKLDKKEEVLREVLVLNAKLRREYLEIFKKYVLGVTINAEHCEIKNIEEIQFASGETKDEIRAFTEKELIIDNPELGYTLYFHLLDFSYNKSTFASYFYGYTRFVDWARDSEAKQKWVRKRKQTYQGSTVHFFRSLVNQQLYKEGFTVNQLRPLPDQKKDTATPKADKQVTNSGSGGMQMASKATEYDLIRLYSDSSYRTYELLIKNGWTITYDKNTSLKQEIMRESFMVNQRGAGTTTGLRLRQEPALINDRGILLTPLNIFYDGMWSYERLANMLPEDYTDE